MPLYEYECKKCGKKFEKLIFSTEKENIKCPFCSSEETKRILSLFSSKGAGCSAPAGTGFS